MSRRPKKPAAKAPEVSEDAAEELADEVLEETAPPEEPAPEPTAEAPESDPTPAEPAEKPAEPAPAVTVVQGPAARDPSLTARIKPPTYDVATWVRSAKLKPGMARAFTVWATQHHPQAKYAPEKWQDFYEKYLLSPVGR